MLTYLQQGGCKKKRPSGITERPKSREETPKKGGNATEACSATSQQNNMLHCSNVQRHRRSQRQTVNLLDLQRGVGVDLRVLS